MRLLCVLIAALVLASCGARSELDVSDADALGTSATDTGPCTLDTLTIRLIGTGCVPASDPAWCDVSVGVSCNGLDAPAPPDCRYAAANMGAGQVFYCCPRCALPP